MKHLISILLSLFVVSLLLLGCKKITIPVLDEVTITQNLPTSVQATCPVSDTQIDRCGFVCGKSSSGLVVEKAKWVVEGELSAGTISGTISGLTPNTIYFIAAYAENEKGIAYSSPLKFTTAPRVPNNDENSYPSF